MADTVNLTRVDFTEMNDKINFIVEENYELKRFSISDIDAGGEISINLDDTNNGPANGLNADTLNGYEAKYFATQSNLDEAIADIDSKITNKAEEIIGNMEFGPDIKLNFSVVNGLEEPTEPIENMIWIQTNENITKTVFNKIEPKNPIENMVWIVTGNSSNVSFNGLTINNIDINEIYPIQAKQYIAGSWIDIAVKSYQNEEWIDWTLYLYHNGLYNIEFEKRIYSNGIGTITEKPNYVLLSRTAETDSQIGWWTNNKINLSQYTKLYIEALCQNAGIISTYDYSFRFGAFNTKNIGSKYAGTNDMLAGIGFIANNAKTIYEVPLTNIGEAYVGIQGTGIVEIYRVWLE